MYLHLLLLQSCLAITGAWYDVWKASLGGHHWEIVNANKSIQVNGSVPGTVHTSLMKAGILGDPYYRFNDAVYKWVAHDNWTYTTHFNAYGHDIGQTDLVFEGLDTIAEVRLNGQSLGSTNNMFRRYVFPVKRFLKGGDNILEVVFTSPVLSAAHAAQQYPYDVPPDCPPPAQQGECHINHLRKEQASFSWDWGPSFPTMGIWKSVYLQGYNSAIISQISTQVIPAGGGDWWVNGTVYFDIGRDSNGSSRTVHGEMVVEAAGSQVHPMVEVTTDKPYAKFSVKVRQTYVQLWWPNGYGAQNLYPVEVNFTSPQYGSEQSLSSVSVGFRTVQLVQEPITDSPGLSFYFKVNDQPIFMKGSNWIPADSFQERVTEDSLLKLLTSAKLAHMTMLRVWGGGVYESEQFYSLADKLGLLIWQDMMFACALYPGDATYLENVRQEITHQVRRLKNHPSVAIWAGNNENEEGMILLAKIDKSKVRAPWSTYYNDYVRLYIDTVRGVVLSEDKTRPFVSSSPSNGVETAREGFVAKNPQDTHYGDVHYYNYNTDTWNYNSFPKPRFASEFGYQSWCSLDSLKPVSEPSDWNLNSSFVAHRQHHPDGQAQLKSEVSLHMNLSISADPQTQFEDFIYLTQINQAVSIKTEVEHYRRMRYKVIEGQGHTMGTLYWQLNDIWQAPTWASIEYEGKWKMLHYYARRFYSPLLLSPLLNATNVQLVFLNESMATMQDQHSRLKQFNTKSTKFSGSSKHTDPKNTLRFDSSVNYVDDKPHGHMTEGVFGPEINGGQRFKYAGDETSCFVPGSGSGLELKVQTYSWASLTPLHTWKVIITEPIRESAEVFQKDIGDLWSEGGCQSAQQCVLVFSVPQCGLQNWLLLSNLTMVKGLMKADIRVKKVSLQSPNSLTIQLSTDQVALFVWLDAPGYDGDGYFSDNGFLMTSKIITISFQSWTKLSKADVGKFTERLTVKSLMDIY